MSDRDKNIDGLIKAANRMITVSLMVIVFAFVCLLQSIFPPHFFDRYFVATPEETAIVTNEYIPPFELNPNEIENGIHKPTGLIVDKGVEEVMVTCKSCHSLEIVIQNRADREGWKELIVWMQKTQNLWQLPNEAIILDYLGKNYAPKNTGRRKNLEDIVWYPYE